MEVKPVVRLAGVLITRSGGCAEKRSAKCLMEKNPSIGEFIKSITGWDEVFCGTLTLDCSTPRPIGALLSGAIKPLGTMPKETLNYNDPQDAARARQRGAPVYYGCIAHSARASRRVVLSQQPYPAVPHRLEIVADVRLREALSVADSDKLLVDIYHGDDWRKLPVTDKP